MPILLRHRLKRATIALEDVLSGSRLDEVLLVVPTKRRIRHLSRELLDQAQRGVAPALPIHTLESLAMALFSASPQARRMVSGPVQSLLFDAAVRSVRDRLAYFRPGGRDHHLFRGTFEKIIAVILHLKEWGIDPATLEAEAARAPMDEKQKLLDVSAIYGAYEEQLSRARLIDVEGLFSALLEQGQPDFTEIFRGTYPGVRTLSLAGFDEFTQPQIAFLEALTRIEDLAIGMAFDFQHGNPALFGHLEDNYRRFNELGFREDHTPDSLLSATAPPRTEATRSIVDGLSRHLFASSANGRKVDTQGRVTVIAARDRIQEVERICALIRTLADEQPDLDLSTVCVAMVHPEPYTGLFREHTARYRIPVNITDRFHLDRSPVVVALLGMLRVASGGFRRDDLLRIAASPYLGLSDGDAPVGPANLEFVSRALRVTGGYGSWLSRIDERLDALRSGPQSDATRRGDQRQPGIEQLERARKDLAHVHSLLAPLSEESTPEEFRRRLSALFGELRVPARIVTRAAVERQDDVERDMRAYQKFLEVVEDTMTVLSFRDGPAARHPLRRFLDQLTVAVSRERYNVHERFRNGVLITSIDETRGLSVGIMIVAGLIDGEFPSVYQPEVFLSEERQQLRRRRHEWQQRYLFYQAVTNFSDRLYLTYPEHDGEVELVRSSFLDALCGAADPVVVRSDERPVPESILAEDEALAWWIRHGANIPEDVLPGPWQASLGEARRAAAIEHSRIEDHSLPEFEGLPGPTLNERARAALEKFSSDVYSATQLETYAACPFKFLAERVLRLRTVDDYRDDLSPLEHGTILHEALFEFFVERRRSGAPQLKGCTDEEAEEALAQLAEIVRRKIDRLHVPDAFWEVDRAVLFGGGRGRRGLLAGIIDVERTREVETTPQHFEVAFGGGPGAEDAPFTRDPELGRDEPVTIGGVAIRGKVDRVDVGPDSFTVIDYKTARKLPRLADMEEGTSLQLPLYLHVIREMLRESGRDLAAAAGIYYQLRPPVRLVMGAGNSEFKERAFAPGEGGRRLLPNGEALDQLVRQTIGFVTGYVRSIAEGKFPLTTPDRIEEVCTYCSYRALCRIQVIRRVASSPQEGS
jgi:ATP-dependent helicase/nuclease subunit B